jgi:Glycosyltransferase family 87
MAAVALDSGTSPASGPAARPRRRLTRSQLGAVVGLIALGTAIRLWIGFTNRGDTFDIESAYIVAQAFAAHPLHVYHNLRYPYPGGFLPLILLCWKFAQATGLAFWGVFKVPTILADAGIATLVAWGLGRFGAAPRERIVSVALVSLGPMFVLISGYHGQIDAVALLPAVAAVILWQLGGEGRAWQAGVLIGLGASVKTFPLFAVFALLPTARSRREAARVIALAVAVPLASVVPFLIADGHATIVAITGTKALPGIGGLSLLIQPSLIHTYLSHPVRTDGLVIAMLHRQNLIVGAAVVLAGAYAYRRRLDAIQASALIWLVVYVANPNWFYQYMIWGLPFFLLAGRRLEVAAVQLALALPAAEVYFRFGLPSLEWLYVPLVDLVWCAFAVATVALILRTRAGRPAALRSG